MMSSGLADVDAWWLCVISGRDHVVKVEAVIGGRLLVSVTGKGVKDEKPSGGVTSLSGFMPE